VGTWHDPDLGRPIAAPLEQCAELLGVDLATVCELAANIEPYLRADGTRIWSLMQLERQLRPEAYRRRRGGYLDRRRTPTGDAWAKLGAAGGTSLLVVLAAAAFGSLVLRFRRSRGEERQQLKWFTYAGALVPLAVVGDALPAPVGDLLFAVPVVFLPVATGTAILRYRIDGLINRTLVYGLLTALLGGVPRSPNRTRNKTFTFARVQEYP
jgi:hypothetical protein